MLSFIKQFNLLLAFLLEIAMLVMLGYWGFWQGSSNTVKYALAAGLPLVVMLLWGVFAAPRSSRRLKNPFRTFFVLILYGITAYLFYQTPHHTLAVSFAVIAFLSVSFAYLFKQ